MQSKEELITVVYAAFNRRDIDAVFAEMHDDVDWPNGMEGGRLQGKDDVRAYWVRQWGMIDPRVDPVHIEDDAAGKTVVDVHQVVREISGEIFQDQMIQHVYSIRDGLIARMEIREHGREEQA
jgi:hypothetical protein